MGAPLVQPGDQNFWFGRPRFFLFLIHFALFQNALFQLAFFAWSTWQFGITSCFHQTPQDTAIRLSVGVIVQVLCSYVTLPLYALVTQMGSSMKPAVFEEGVAETVKNWHHKAETKAKHSQHSERTTPFSTPPHGMSPVHLLQNANNHSEVTEVDDLFPAPEASVVVEMQHWDTEGSRSPKYVGSSERGGIRQPCTLKELGRIQELPAFSFSQPQVSSPSGISSARSRK